MVHLKAFITQISHEEAHEVVDVQMLHDAVKGFETLKDDQ